MTISDIEILFRIECRSLTPVFNLIYIYRQRHKFLRIDKYIRSYYASLSVDQQDVFGLAFWMVVLLELWLVNGDVLYLLVWISAIGKTDFLSFFFFFLMSHESLSEN